MKVGQILSISFDMAAWEILGALTHGGTLVIRGQDFTATASELDEHEVEAFTAGNRGFELCFASLQKYVMQRIARGGDEPERLLIEKAVQNRAWEECDRAAGSEGRKQLQKRLRGLVAALDKAC